MPGAGHVPFSACEPRRLELVGYLIDDDDLTMPKRLPRLRRVPRLYGLDCDVGQTLTTSRRVEGENCRPIFDGGISVLGVREISAVPSKTLNRHCSRVSIKDRSTSICCFLLLVYRMLLDLFVGGNVRLVSGFALHSL